MIEENGLQRFCLSTALSIKIKRCNYSSENNTPRRRGFTFPEALIGIIVMCLLVAAIYRIISSGMRGVKHGQETVDYIQTAARVFRALDKDLKCMITTSLRDGSGAIPRLYELSPNPTNANTLTFRKFFVSSAKCEIRQVTYRLEAATKEISRSEYDCNGKTLISSFRFGNGFVEEFSIQDLAGESKKIKVAFTLGEGKGKSKKSTFQRIFSAGMAFSSGEFRNWVFHFL